ncbi:glycosyltransferase family 4 protein [Ruminococcus sp.]|uniref:glycosyltransferase family 4 protein n=1 Tax=Ruminococcus sp. TaxID=41978 RepID=UPI0038906B33
MKILFFCTFYHRALLFRQQMDSLMRRGHYVRAFSSAKYGEGVADKFKPIMDDKVVHKECWNSIDRTLFFPRQWKIERELQKAYDLKTFDVLHPQLLLSSGYSALRMKKKYGLPYVVSVRVTDLTGFIRLPFFRKLANKILMNAGGVLFLSNTHKNELLQKFAASENREAIEKKSYVIGNCLEPFWTQNRSKPRTAAPDPKKELRILSVAKIRPIKNLCTAARAVELLRQQGYRASLTVVGEDQDHEELERIKAFDCVNYIPFLTKEELIDVYASHDIFLLPSVNETFGRVYLEAMTQGLPVLYSKGQGFDGNYPDGEVGYAVCHDDPDEIARRILQITENYPRISEACVHNSIRFDEDVIMDQMERFYEESLHRK